MTQPGEFKSALDPRAQNVSCSVKASQGQLFLLKTAIVFIQKPICLMMHSELKYVEFQRVSTGKSFDIEIVGRETTDQFKNIDKAEYPALMTYFRKSGLKMRQRSAETGDVEELSDMGSDQIDEEIRQS